MAGREQKHKQEDSKPRVAVARNVSIKRRNFESPLRIEIVVQADQSGAVRNRCHGCDYADDERRPTRNAVTQQICIRLQKCCWN